MRKFDFAARGTDYAARAVILAAVVVALALLGLNVRNFRFYVGSASDVLYYFGLPAGLVAATLGALALTARWRLAVALSFLAVVPALYGAELFLTLEADQRLARAARAGGVVPDTRRKIDVVSDLRRAGVAAYPSVRAKELLVAGTDGERVSPLEPAAPPLLPLASVPGRTVVACNETGQWLVYDSDRHGFRNPDSAWTEPPALALIGDSFVHGDCVASDADLGTLLRRSYGRVLNLGTSGFGPLSMLASVKEYLPELRPPSVLWFFFEGNDITKDLPIERRSAILRSYLDAGFRQGLVERRDEVAQRLSAYLDRHMADAIGAIDRPFEALLDFLELDHLRETFGLDNIAIGVVDDVGDDDFDLFRAVLAEAKRTVGAWGGRLWFVYLPDSTRYFPSPVHGRIRDSIRTRVLSMVDDLKLPLIDIHDAFAAHPDAATLFRFPWTHYNEDGYGAVAAAVERALGPPPPDRVAGGGERRPSGESGEGP